MLPLRPVVTLTFALTPVRPLPSPMNCAAVTLPLTVKSPAVVRLGA
ncbi:hypothetical protein ACVOMS_11270 [Bradyrhizobium guangxiense]